MQQGCCESAASSEGERSALSLPRGRQGLTATSLPQAQDDGEDLAVPVQDFEVDAFLEPPARDVVSQRTQSDCSFDPGDGRSRPNVGMDHGRCGRRGCRGHDWVNSPALRDARRCLFWRDIRGAG